MKAKEEVAARLNGKDNLRAIKVSNMELNEAPKSNVINISIGDISVTSHREDDSIENILKVVHSISGNSVLMQYAGNDKKKLSTLFA